MENSAADNLWIIIEIEKSVRNMSYIEQSIVDIVKLLLMLEVL